MAHSFSLTSPQTAFAQDAWRHRVFLVSWIVSLIVFGAPLRGLVSLALHDDRYSHILLVPFVTAGILWLQQKRILLDARYCPRVGIPLVLAGIALGCSGTIQRLSLGQNASLAITAFAIVLTWTALFALCYGIQVVRSATFPLLFLLLMIPIPTPLIDEAVLGLQNGSAAMSYGLFKLVGIPVLRDGFQLSLPGLDIEVAKECSGIRSSQSLFIASLLAGHLLLRSGWNQLWLVLLSVPIAIFKNAVRIVTISSLGVYVDRGFLFGNLHRYGGLPFSLLAVGMLALVIRVLRKSEPHPESADAVHNQSTR
jgi:exosortase